MFQLSLFILLIITLLNADFVDFNKPFLWVFETLLIVSILCSCTLSFSFQRSCYQHLNKIAFRSFIHKIWTKQMTPAKSWKSFGEQWKRVTAFWSIRIFNEFSGIVSILPIHYCSTNDGVKTQQAGSWQKYVNVAQCRWIGVHGIPNSYATFARNFATKHYRIQTFSQWMPKRSFKA